MKRITLFAGHYGSGKTCIAVSYAKYLKQCGCSTAIVDLDIVNPYFRTKDSEAELEALGIELVCSEYANTNLDAPALPKEIYTAVNDETKKLVIDVGGDDRGAVALGRYAPDILEQNDYEMIFVVNFSRPLTQTAQDAFEVMREIEIASGMAFTAIVNNTNLGDATDLETIQKSTHQVAELSKLSGLEVIMTTACEPTYGLIKNDYPNAFKIELQDKYYSIK